VVRLMQNIDKFIRLSEPNSTSSRDPTITSEEMQRIITICVDLLTICANLSRTIDPAIGAMIAYAGDEFLENVVSTTRSNPSGGQPQQRIKHPKSSQPV
jgi:hypothetical protein